MLTQKIKDHLANTVNVALCDGVIGYKGRKIDNVCNDTSVTQFFEVAGLEGKFKFYMSLGTQKRDRPSGNHPAGTPYQYIYGTLTDYVSGCYCNFRINDLTDMKDETVLKDFTKRLKALIKKTPTQRVKVAARQEAKATKRGQKETFEAMIKSLELEHKLTVSNTGKVVKVQVNSDIEKMKKIFAILADKTYEEVEDLYTLASIQ
jgi:hypothetical protein